jgi:hypothetical protein
MAPGRPLVAHTAQMLIAMGWTDVQRTDRSPESHKGKACRSNLGPVHDEPSANLAALENLLRGLIRHRVREDEWSELLNAEDLRERRDQEAKRRPGVVVSDDLLDYTYVWHLTKIVLKFWDRFKPILGGQAEFKVDMGRIEDMRNAPSHGRELTPHERHLLAGIVGRMRNRVSLYNSESSPDAKHYPILVSITDSFGNVLTPDDARTPVKFVDTSGRLRLQPGQTVEFVCRATDAQGRPLAWRLGGGRSGGDEATGDDVTLVWNVTEEDVRVDRHVTITLTSTGPYHRRDGTHDFYAVFTYTVDPPA